MKKLDNKGMSLVEVVMAILIVSIASVLLVQSLSTVTRLISEADLRTRTTNDQLSALVGSKVNEGISIVSEEKEVVIQAEGLVDDITVLGDYEVATSSNESEISLHNFNADENREDIYERMLSNAKELYEKLVSLKTKADMEKYLNELEEQAGIDITVNMLNEGFGNDQFRAFYYLRYGFPTVKEEIVKECDDIFQDGHPNAKHGEAKAKFNGREMYWKIYYLYNSTPQPKFLLRGGFTNDLGTDGWRTGLVYNEKDQSVYYKLFPSDGTGSDAGSYIGLTGYGSSTTGFLTLQTELLDKNQWKKLNNK